MQPHRLPAWARAQNSDGQLAVTEAQPAGVRLVLRSQATVLELDALQTTVTYRGAPPRPDGVYELLVDGRHRRYRVATEGDERRYCRSRESTICFGGHSTCSPHGTPRVASGS
jgi:hypothetical protein